MAKPLQDMKETDILEIAQKELTERQLQILAVVLTQDPFDKPLSSLVQLPAKPACNFSDWSSKTGASIPSWTSPSRMNRSFT
jgi:hypothetical protein